MTDKLDNNEQKGEAGAGPSRRVSPEEQAGHHAAETGPEDGELRWAQQHVPEDKRTSRPVRGVFRKTELHGNAPPSTPDERKKARKRTAKNLKDPVGEIPYRQFETVTRDFLCSLIERQDMIQEEALLHVADLQQRIDALENRLEQARRAASGIPDVKG